MKTYTPHRGFTLLQAVIVLATLVLLAMILFPVFNRAREPGGRRHICQSNLKQIALGFKQYIQDYDEKYPPLALDVRVVPNEVSGSAFGWAQALQPYLRSTRIFQCDKEPNGPNPDPTKSGYTDYWFNARMAGVSEAKLDGQALMVALGDGDSSNARYHLWGIPRNWMGNPASPLYRHLEGANYAFADGHVKWFKNDAWGDSLDMKNGNDTFRLKPTK